MDNYNIIQEIDNIEIASSVKCNVEYLHNYIVASHNNFTTLTQNIRSIYKNFDDLQVTLTQLKCEVDLIILTECRLNQAKSIPVLSNYNSFQTTNLLN